MSAEAKLSVRTKSRLAYLHHSFAISNAFFARPPASSRNATVTSFPLGHRRSFRQVCSNPDTSRNFVPANTAAARDRESGRGPWTWAARSAASSVDLNQVSGSKKSVPQRGQGVILVSLIVFSFERC